MYRIFLYGSSLLFSFYMNKIKMLYFWRFCRLRKGLGSCCIWVYVWSENGSLYFENEKQGSKSFLPVLPAAYCVPVVFRFIFGCAVLPIPDIFDNILGGGAGAAVFPDLLFHFLQGVYHRGMIPAAKFLSDGGGWKLGDLPDYIHSHLPGL